MEHQHGLEPSGGSIHTLEFESPTILSIVQKNRHCDAFTSWQYGFTPKEHRDMLDRQWLLDREDRRDKEQRGLQRVTIFVLAVTVLVTLFIGYLNYRGIVDAANLQRKTAQQIAEQQANQQPPIVNNYIQVLPTQPSPTPAS